MSSTPNVPTVPAATDVAAGQQTYNTNAAEASQQGSMVNQTNPFGSLTYNQTGTSANGTPLYTANTQLDPTQQNLLNILNQTKTTAGTQGSNLLSGANYGAIDPSTAIGNATSGLVGGAMNKEIQYLNPYFQQQTDQLDTKLRNQGFAPGDPGYDNAMRAVQNNQGNTVTGFEAQIEPQMYNQAYQTYMTPATLATSLSNFGSPTMPSWVQTPQLSVQPADLTGATSSANQANMAAYQAQLGQNQSMMSGLFGIPTAVLGGLAKGGSLNGLSSLFSGAGAAGAAGAGADISGASLAGLTDALGAAAII